MTSIWDFSFDIEKQYRDMTKSVHDDVSHIRHLTEESEYHIYNEVSTPVRGILNNMMDIWIPII